MSVHMSLLINIKHKLPARRTVLRWGHMMMIPLFIWFVFITPDVILQFGQGAFRFHSNLALLFVVICLIWTIDMIWRGLASRPGPKLPPWARRLHQIMHKTIIWGLFLVAIGGFLLGLTSFRLLKAGGFLPIAPPMGWKHANEVIGTLHIYQFYILGVIIVGHAAFHIWRHYKLRDNALRIMAPRFLHKWL